MFAITPNSPRPGCHLPRPDPVSLLHRLPHRALLEDGNRQLPSEHWGQGQSILASFGVWPMVRRIGDQRDEGLPQAVTLGQAVQSELNRNQGEPQNGAKGY